MNTPAHILLINGVKNNDVDQVQTALTMDFTPVLTTGTVMDYLVDEQLDDLLKWVYDNAIYNLIYHEIATLYAARLGHAEVLNLLITYNTVLFEKYSTSQFADEILEHNATFRVLIDNSLIFADFMPSMFDQLVKANDIKTTEFVLNNGFDLPTCCNDEQFINNAITYTHSKTLVEILHTKSARTHANTQYSELMNAVGRDINNSIVQYLVSLNLFDNDYDAALVKASNTNAINNAKTMLDAGANPKSISLERIKQLLKD
jgi:hypothetical protein